MDKKYSKMLKMKGGIKRVIISIDKRLDKVEHKLSGNAKRARA